jgi:hypothetical protein
MLRSSLVAILLAGLTWAGPAGEELVPSAEYVHPDAAGKLKVAGNVAVLMTGNDRFVNRVLEDLLAVDLMKQDLKVVYPTEANLGRSREPITKDPVEFARGTGANLVITGSVVTEPESDEQWRSTELSLASFSLVDIPMNKTLVWVLYEPEKPVTSSRLARSFVRKMIDSLK